MLIRLRNRLGAALLASAALTGAATAAPPQVVVTILPVHALVAGVTEGITAPHLLLESSASPHRYSLRPSQARALQSADLVVWVGAALETFLERELRVAGGRRQVITLMDVPGIRVLETRRGGTFEAHDHAHASATAHAVGHGDPHIWLDPDNARAIVGATARELARLDPRRASRYQDNAAALDARIVALDGELRATLAPVVGQPYIVFHDAYHAFEAHYGLDAVGAVTLNPQRAPGAARIRQLRAGIRASGARCVFSEPQFEPRLVETLIEDTGARAGVLDPMGSDIEPGPGAWFTLMRNLARSLRSCLATP